MISFYGNSLLLFSCAALPDEAESLDGMEGLEEASAIETTLRLASIV